MDILIVLLIVLLVLALVGSFTPIDTRARGGIWFLLFVVLLVVLLTRV